MPPTSKAILEIDKSDLDRGRRLHFYPKGEKIPLLPQGVWQVDRGLVQVSTLCLDGEKVLLGWAGSSSFFGVWLFQSLSLGINQLAQPSFYTSYEALSDVYLRWYALREIENSPRLTLAILPHLGKQVRQREALLAIVGQKRVEDRLRELLLLLQQEIGQPVPEGTRLSARFTHQNLANAIGATRVTITKLLGKFHDQGWISRDRDRYIIVKKKQDLRKAP